MNKLSIVRIVSAIILVSLSWCGSVQADISREYQLKAAYLLNFARFIYWPEKTIESSEYFNICVVGENPFADSLNKLSDKKIKNKQIKISYADTFNKETNCRILYISDSRKRNFKEILKLTESDVILTVSDIDGFVRAGGMIEFVRVRNKIKFEINVSQSNKSNIKYRSQLLEVAEGLK